MQRAVLPPPVADAPSVAGVLSIDRAEHLAAVLVPLVEAAVAPLRAELAEVRTLLSARDQELGHLRGQDDRLEIALGRDSESRAVEPTQTSAERRSGRPWWRFWHA